MNVASDEKPISQVWSGVYLTWDEACSAASAVGGQGMRGDVWFKRITEQLTNYREELRLYGVAVPPRPSNLPMLCAMTRPCTTADSGGSG